MTSTAVRPPRFSVRGVQLSRAALAAIAAMMITFSSDHSAALGLAVFSGFALATGLVLLVAAWLTYPQGRRWAPLATAVVCVAAGMAGGVPAWRTTGAFFGIVIAWAAVTGLVELVQGLRERSLTGLSRAEARDHVAVGVLGLVLAVGVLLVPAQFALDYAVDGAGEFTLTGITIAVGLFGGYAAIIAVYLAIAAFSPRADALPARVPASGGPEAQA